MKHTLYITVKIQVESDLEEKDMIHEFESNSFYNFYSTENVTVLETEYLKTDTFY